MSSPSAVFSTLLSGLTPAAGSSGDDRLAQWDGASGLIAALREFGRDELAALPFSTTWQPLLAHTLTTVVDTLSAHDAANEGAESGDDEDAEESELSAACRRRLVVVGRVLLLAKNLCPVTAFQTPLRAALPSSKVVAAGAALVAGLGSSLSGPCHTVLKHLLQLVANALTPTPNTTTTDSNAADSSTETDDAVWTWVRMRLYPRVLRSVLSLGAAVPGAYGDLASSAACVLHHALLCRSADTTCSSDLPPMVRSAARGLADEAAMFYAVLRAALPVVQSQLAALNADEADGPPLLLSDWRPHASEPVWALHLVGLCVRASSSFLSRVSRLCVSVAEHDLLLRLVELWSEDLHEGEEAAQELQRLKIAAEMNEDEKASATAPPVDLTYTAEAVAGNAAFLLEWVQRREHIPLPVVVLPPSAPPAAASTGSPSDASASSTAAAASSSAAAGTAVPVVATTSVPLDSSTHAVLNTLGNWLLFRSWDRTPVFTRTREALVESGVVRSLLDMLSAADTLDGGSMFSDLYSRPAGHTRHTKPSNDPKAYVNQFGEGSDDDEENDDAAASSAPAAAPAAAAAAAALPSSRIPAGARRTPYLFKSHILRLVASLAFQHTALQTAFGSEGVYACMNHSVLDDHNPLMREYAVLAVRNLLEGHDDNQRAVADLRVDSVANQEELRDIGVETTMDPTTGAIKIANMPKA